jgi:flagellar M-ring protein FliF
MLIRPAMKASQRRPELRGPALAASVDETLELPDPGTAHPGSELRMPEGHLGTGMTIAQSNALQLARADPTAVATVVKGWISAEKAASA